MTNTEAKQEAIKKAYGEYYDALKKYLNGFMVDRVNYERETGNKLSYLEGINFIDEPLVYSYPDTVEGFQDNNGWIRIESEDDLPKESFDCYIILKNGEKSEWFYHHDTFLNISEEYFLEEVSHYQKKLFPKPPIY